jgi:hypothetical protein
LKIIDVSGIKTANNVSDFNELEFMKFAMRTGDRWSFFIPAAELQSLDELLPDHVLIVENYPTAIGCEIMCGKLVKKVGKGLHS